MIGMASGRDFCREGPVVGKKRETFGAVLARLRKAAGMSGYELAKRTGLTSQAVSYLETSGGTPTWETVQLIAKALGLTCAAFEDAGLTLPEYKPGKPGPKPGARRGKK
jgi:transcriptional regulator with XRE-family HTH domain